MVSDSSKLALNARASLGSYCHTECLAYCCRTHYLLLSKEEVKLLCLNIEDLKIMPVDKRYIFNLAKGCPKLTDFKCKIHKSKERPKACQEFPLFIHDKTVIITDDCPAVKENRLYPFLAQFKSMGFKIVYTTK